MLTQERIRRARARAQALGDGVREASAEAVVRRVFAVQAQDAVAADLGIRARGQDIGSEDIRAACEDERSILRGWFMRGTLHTIPGPDARWVLRLLAPRILAATSRRYHQLGLDDGLRERADRLARRALATHGPLTRAELTEHLTAIGVQPDGQAPFHLIRHAALTGVLCHGPRRGDEATYVLLDDWLPTGAGDSRREEDTAVAELARRYVRAHAPVGWTTSPPGRVCRSPWLAGPGRRWRRPARSPGTAR
ncbi:DNA glycosylase AlkZ-like family protein [Peterkaempfera sp. SMS 1(5)a]|uniref:DNA glycosylase AlkZ-like family protein n=1 Tax=Peterkaempfera podocarpi TaxID=3232308 RepID=UPI00366E51D4